MKALNKFTATLCLCTLSAIVGSVALAQQVAPIQQNTFAYDAPAQVPPRAPEPATGKPAEAVPAKPANGWRAVSTRQPGEALKIKLTNGSVIKGNFRSASDDGLVLELKNKELNLGRDEIATISGRQGKLAAGGR